MLWKRKSCFISRNGLFIRLQRSLYWTHSPRAVKNNKQRQTTHLAKCSQLITYNGTHSNSIKRKKAEGYVIPPRSSIY